MADEDDPVDESDPLNVWLRENFPNAGCVFLVRTSGGDG